MATKRETNVVYGAGLAQGIVLVTFPAASTIFTDPDEYDLTNTQYGFLFIPQVVTAIAASLLGAWLARRFGTKRVYLVGLVAGLTSMALLIVSTFFESNKSAALPLLLLATAFLGVGFGLTVPALNTLTAAFHPDGVETSVLVLNALLGLGTALAPVFVAIFVGLGFWWGLPVLSAALLALLILGSLRLPLRTESRATVARERRGIPARFWVFGGFAVLYGICETVNGNWSQLDMTRELGASTTVAAIALTTFWAMVTVGRIGVAGIQRWVPSQTTYRVLPFLLAATFVVIALLGDGDTGLGVLAFGGPGSAALRSCR
jgi:MFS family permease